MIRIKSCRPSLFILILLHLIHSSPSPLSIFVDTALGHASIGSHLANYSCVPINLICSLLFSSISFTAFNNFSKIQICITSWLKVPQLPFMHGMKSKKFCLFILTYETSLFPGEVILDPSSGSICHFLLCISFYFQSIPSA